MQDIKDILDWVDNAAAQSSVEGNAPTTMHLDSGGRAMCGAPSAIAIPGREVRGCGGRVGSVGYVSCPACIRLVVSSLVRRLDAQTASFYRAVEEAPYVAGPKKLASRFAFGGDEETTKPMPVVTMAELVGMEDIVGGGE